MKRLYAIVRGLLSPRKLALIWNPGQSKKQAGAHVQIVLQTFVLDDEKINELIVAIPIGTANKTTKLVFEFPIGVTHNFKEGIKDVTIKSIFSESSPLPVPNDGIGILHNSYAATKIKREYYKDSKGQFVLIKYPAVKDGTTFLVNDLMAIGPSVIETTVPITTKDEIRLKQKVRALFAHYFDVEVLLEDKLVSKAKFKIFGFEANNIKDLLAVYMKNVLKDKPKTNFEKDAEVSYLYCPVYSELHRDKYGSLMLGKYQPEQLLPLKWNPA